MIYQETRSEIVKCQQSQGQHFILKSAFTVHDVLIVFIPFAACECIVLYCHVYAIVRPNIVIHSNVLLYYCSDYTWQ